MKLYLWTLLLLAISCGSKKTGTSNVALKLGFSLSQAQMGRLMVHGVSLENGVKFGKLVTSSSMSLELPNGNWKLMATYWDGAEVFSGNVKCDLQQMNLLGGDVDVNLNLTSSKCQEFDFSPGSDTFYNNVGGFVPINMVNCESMPGTTGVGGECDSQIGAAKSYSIHLVDYDMTDYLSEGSMVSSGVEMCFNMALSGGKTYVNNSGIALPRIPVINHDFSPFAVEIVAYDYSDCQGSEKSFKFPSGLLRNELHNSSDYYFRISDDASYSLFYHQHPFKEFSSLTPQDIISMDSDITDTFLSLESSGTMGDLEAGSIVFMKSGSGHYSLIKIDSFDLISHQLSIEYKNIDLQGNFETAVNATINGTYTFDLNGDGNDDIWNHALDAFNVKFEAKNGASFYLYH